MSLGLVPSPWPGEPVIGSVMLEVTARRSGRVRSRVVTWEEHGGSRYLVSMLGKSAWVRDVRAAGGRATLHRGRRTDVRLVEVPAVERPPILQAWLRRTGISAPPRRNLGLDREARIEEFVRIAPRHPVFRIEIAPD